MAHALGVSKAKHARTRDDFANEIGMGAPFVRRRAAALAALGLERFGDVADALADEAFGGEHLGRFADVIAERAKTLVALGERRRSPSRLG